MPIKVSDADQARIEAQGQRRRLLEGRWMVDALDRQVAFYSKESRNHLPAPDLSRNPVLEIVVQLATLYDDMPTLDAQGADEKAMERLVLPRVWQAVMADRLKHQIATNEALIRVDISADERAADRRLSYRVVYADTVTEVVRDPKDDRRLIGLRERRPRCVPGTSREEMTWETWDASDPKAPIFRIEAERKNEGGSAVMVDVTAEYSGSNAYPYSDAEGPVFPYALAHARIGAHLWDCDSGAEVVSGALTGSALITMWVGGLRDNSSPPIYTKDLTILVQAASNQLVGASETVRMDNSTILQTVSKSGTTSGEIGRLPAGADPKSSFEAIELYFSGLGASFGIKPDDVSRGVASSGYAIVLSRAGERRARKRLEGPCAVVDQIILSTGARLLNAYGGTNLPTKPEDYAIAYAQLESSPEETKALLEETNGLLAAGLISHKMAMKRHHPNSSDEQIEEMLAEIAAEKAGPVVDSAEGVEPTDAAPAEEAPVPIPVTPTDVAGVVTVNEVRASLGLPPAPVDGGLTVAQYQAKNAATIAAAANAAAGQADGEPPPQVGLGRQGAPPPKDAEPAEEPEEQPGAETPTEKPDAPD